MPPLKRESNRIVIAGAASLRGVELRSLLEESRFAGVDLRLLDEVVATGILTEAGGEPAVIQAVEESSFDRARYVFFTGSPEFTKRNVAAAKSGKSKIIDLSGGLAESPETVAWFPKLDWLCGREFPKNSKVYAIPSAGASAAAALALALSKIGLRRLSIVCFQPVSDVGRAGIEELETQTGQLLSFQGVGQPAFDTQVAFNMLDRFGPGSIQKLSDVRERLRVETRTCLADKGTMPALQVIHAPVFYGTTFAASAELDVNSDVESLVKSCTDAGFAISLDGEAGPSNVNASGQKAIQLAKPEEDPAHPRMWWFWGAADNIRLPAAYAVKLAEMLS